MDAFEHVARLHLARYPRMRPQDFGKLAFQSEFGPEHLIADGREAAEAILLEWQGVTGSGAACNPEPIGGGFCRYHLTEAEFSAEAAETLAKLFVQSAATHTGTMDGLYAKLSALERLTVEGMDAWLKDYRLRGCPPVRHSGEFRAAYAPHYRVVRITLLCAQPSPFPFHGHHPNE